MKQLDMDAVRKAAEYLMDKFGSTTTLDVKNRLRTEGYTAFQADVSRFMSMLTNTDNWKFNQQGSYRVYSLGPDTQDVLSSYLEKGDEFWEVSVDQKKLTIASGKVGTSGQTNVQTFSKNRKAIAQAEELITTKKQVGFVEAQDTRLALSVRQKYDAYMSLSPTSCRIGYYDLKKIEKQSIEFNTQQGNKLGYIQTTKNLGCYFIWNNPEHLKKIENLLKEIVLDAKQVTYDEIEILGEKLISRDLYDDSGQSINKPLDYKEQASSELMNLELNPEHIFQIVFQFDNQVKVVLSKFDLDLQNELIPIAAQILNNLE